MPGRTGGLRPRLTRLTTPEMKKYISDAVAANKRKPDPKPGDKLLAEMNKQWAVVLKAQREYEAMIGVSEKMVTTLAGKDLDDPAWADAENAIRRTQKRTKEIAADVLKFEQAEKKLTELLKITPVAGGL